MTEKTPPLAEAIRAVRTELDAAEASVGSYDAEPDTWIRRHRAAMAEVSARLAEKVGARIDTRWDGARVRIHGIASTSTGGTAGALRNWLRAAEAREARS